MIDALADFVGAIAGTSHGALGDYYIPFLWIVLGIIGYKFVETFLEALRKAGAVKVMLVLAPIAIIAYRVYLAGK